MSSFHRKYYYSQLEHRLQRITDKIVNALRHYQTDILLMQPVTRQEIIRIMDVIDKDFPELFYLDLKTQPFEVIALGAFQKLKVVFAYESAQIKMLEKRLTRMTAQILVCDLEISAKSLCAREEAIYQYLCGCVHYNEGTRGLADHTIVGALITGTAVCEGYAKAFKYLCERADISCLVVVGKARQQRSGALEAHAWNIVRLGEIEYAHVDLTWDGMNPDFPCAFFNLSDATMQTDHWWDASLVPSCDGSLESELPMIQSVQELVHFLARNLTMGRHTMLFKLNRLFDMPALCRVIDRAWSRLDADFPCHLKNYTVRSKQAGEALMVCLKIDLND